MCKTERKFHADLLLIENENCSHYVLILNMSRFFAIGNKKKHFCKSCLNYFYTEDKLNAQVKIGCPNVRTILPEKSFVELEVSSSTPPMFMEQLMTSSP